MEHHENMTAKIDAALAGVADQGGNAFAHKPPEEGFVERPGFEDNEAHWEEVRRIAEETERDGGIPLEGVIRWVESWDTDNELPPPEPRPRNPG
jgi:hypothetical protein